jgi:hypothetical protein
MCEGSNLYKKLLKGVPLYNFLGKIYEIWYLNYFKFLFKNCSHTKDCLISASIVIYYSISNFTYICTNQQSIYSFYRYYRISSIVLICLKRILSWASFNIFIPFFCIKNKKIIQIFSIKNIESVHYNVQMKVSSVGCTKPLISVRLVTVIIKQNKRWKVMFPSNPQASIMFYWGRGQSELSVTKA